MSKSDRDDLETLLRARLNDPRAMTGALSINADRVFATFGAVGRHPRIVLQVSGDEMTIVAPEGRQRRAYSDGDDPVDPDDHLKDDLLKMAQAASLTIAEGATKAEIAEAINKAREKA